MASCACWSVSFELAAGQHVLDRARKHVHVQFHPAALDAVADIHADGVAHVLLLLGRGELRRMRGAFVAAGLS